MLTLIRHFAMLAPGAQNMGVAIDISEFSYLPAQAEALGVPVPPAERLTLALPDGRTASALRPRSRGLGVR